LAVAFSPTVARAVGIPTQPKKIRVTDAAAVILEHWENFLRDPKRSYASSLWHALTARDAPRLDALLAEQTFTILTMSMAYRGLLGDNGTFMIEMFGWRGSNFDMLASLSFDPSILDRVDAGILIEERRQNASELTSVIKRIIYKAGRLQKDYLWIFINQPHARLWFLQHLGIRVSDSKDVPPDDYRRTFFRVEVVDANVIRKVGSNFLDLADAVLLHTEPSQQ
jgi:hypothetical protein